MDEQLLQSEGVFEITDHTTASKWERFIANLEEILTDWNLHKQSNLEVPYRELSPRSIANLLWREKQETLRLGNVTFQVRYQHLHNDDEDGSIKQVRREPDDNEKPETSAEQFLDTEAKLSEFRGAENEERYSANSSHSEEDGTCAISKQEEREHEEHELPENAPSCLRDLVSTTNDFASRAHCLVRWYNLRRFIILSPKGDTIVTEDKIKLILSSASIALANIDCHVPIFVQIHNPKNHFYQGISEHLNYRTTYEMVYYKRSIKQYAYLSELISMFREKTGCYLSDPISATIRLNYCLSSFDLFLDSEQQFSGNMIDDEQDELVKMTKPKQQVRPRAQDLRSGATFEQVTEALGDCLPHPYKILKFIHIGALWPPVSDKVVTDSHVHSDLDPVEAPIWTIRCVTNDNCNLKIVHETQAIYQLLNAAVNYAYDKMDADVSFGDCDREALKSRCLRLSYDLATQPEVILSERQSDSMRKLVALLFHQAAELTNHEDDALDQIASQLKKKRLSLNEIYRTFNRRHRTSVKEFIIRTKISRPFNPISTPALPQRMFCTVSDEELRLCGAFTELCN